MSIRSKAGQTFICLDFHVYWIKTLIITFKTILLGGKVSISNVYVCFWRFDLSFRLPSILLFAGYSFMPNFWKKFLIVCFRWSISLLDALSEKHVQEKPNYSENLKALRSTDIAKSINMLVVKFSIFLFFLNKLFLWFF